jgi:hypothetical protein
MKKAMWLALVAVLCCQASVSLWAQVPTADSGMVAAPVVDSSLSPVEAAWPLGEVREYLFHMNGQEMGWQWNQLVASEGVGPGTRYDLKFTLSLDLGALGQSGKMNMDGKLILTPQGQPLAYQLNVAIGEERQQLMATFAEEKVQATVTEGGRESQHMVPYTPGIFVVDNNMIGQWGLMLGLLPLTVQDHLLARIFIPQALDEMDIEVEVLGQETLMVNGTEQLTSICHIAPIDEICWVTENGLLVRLEDEKQNLVITLLPSEKAK